MGINAHSLADLIINLTKGKNRHIPELYQLGEELYKIMEYRVPYMMEYINKANYKEDYVENLLLKLKNSSDMKEKKLRGVILTNYTKDADKTLIISAISRVYNMSIYEATSFYEYYIQNDEELKKELIYAIYQNRKDFPCQELGQISFSFQVPISLIVLKHLTRHRRNQVLIPDFTPIKNLKNTITPPSIKENKIEFDSIYQKNYHMYEYFKKLGIRDRDLIYFYQDGNCLNVGVTMDGNSLLNFTEKRNCRRAQWEIQNISRSMIREVSEVSPYYSLMLGSSCEVEGKCYEGRECCGKIKSLSPHDVHFSKNVKINK